MLDLSSFQGLDQEITMDAQGGQRCNLLIGRNGSHIKVSPGAYRIVRGVYLGQSFDALAEEFSAKGGSPVSRMQIQEAYEAVVERLESIDGRAREGVLPAGFWVRCRLLPAAVVDRLAGWLAPAFHPLAASLLLVLTAVLFALTLHRGLALQIRGGDFWLGYLLFTASLLIHELGHASACARYGASPSDIGLTIYLVYPAFYSDVTSAWRLRRWQRVVVDLGGLYFQFVVAAAFAAAYLAWGWQPFQVAFAMVWFGALFNLNPIFKFDGYWLLGDALGITNLSRQPALIASRLLARLRGRKPEPSPWPFWLTAVLIVYSLAAGGMWLYFIVRLAPFLIRTTLGLPGSLRSLASAIAHRAAAGVVWGQAGTLLATLFLLFITWFGFWMLLNSFVVAPLRTCLRPPKTSRGPIEDAVKA